MNKYLLDTNHASRLLMETDPLQKKVADARIRGHQVGVTISVVGELYYFVYASQRTSENLARLRQLLPILTVWPFDAEAAEMFGIIRAEQRRKGLPIPALDAQIAAVARLHGLAVLTADCHFAFVSDLVAENWLE